MNSAISQCEEKMEKAISSLKSDLNSVRTGRASPRLLDKIQVESYGQKTNLSQLATISAPEARTLMIQPWDRNLIGEIEKAIQKSDLALNPSSDGKIIRIQIPPLSEDRRKELVKIAKNMAEQCRVSIRNIRREGIDAMKSQEHIAQDVLAKYESNLQKITDYHIELVAKTLDEKEKEIREV